MKASGQIEVFIETPIVVGGPLKGVRVAQSCVLAPIVPCAVVAQV